MPSVVDALSNVARRLTFWLRNALPWSMPAWKLPARSWERATDRLPGPAREHAVRLRAEHDLSRWPELLTPLEMQENLHLLDLMVRILPTGLPGGPGLDVGSKNGSILPALIAASARPWDLVELDAHRRYIDFSTRAAHGRAIARAYPACRYLAGSVEALDGSYAVITWILPFVHEGPLRAWGLPHRYFTPQKLLRHVANLLAPGGVLLIINQGEGERDTQRELFAELGLTPDELGQLDGPLSPFRRARYGFRWQRPGVPSR